MQSFVFDVTFQLVFEVAVVGNLARFIPYFSGVVVSDVPEFAGRPPVPVERFSYLAVVEDFRSMGAVDFQHSKRLYKRLYSRFCKDSDLRTVEYPALLSTVGCGGVVGFIPRLKARVFSSHLIT